MSKLSIKPNKVEIKGGKRKIVRVPLGMRKPDFDTLLSDDIDNPLDAIEYPGDAEGNATTEIGAALQAIKDEKKKLRDQYRVTTDTNYYFCVCFQSEQQKLKFLDASGWRDLGERFLDGLVVAKRLGIDIDPILLAAKPVKSSPRGLRDADYIVPRSD